MRYGFATAAGVVLVSWTVVGGERATIAIDQTAPCGWTVPQTLYGLFLEDISNGIDGALYPELVWNRGFDFPSSDNRGMPEGWKKDCRKNSTCRATLTYVDPKFAKTPAYLRIEAVGAGAGVANVGANLGSRHEMSVKAGTPLALSLWARGDVGFDVAVKRTNGVHLARASFKATGAWRLFTARLVPSADEKTAALQIRVKGTGTLDLEQVSLKQATFAGCGLRRDIVQLMKDLHPLTFRFPGGSNLDGHTFEEWFDWKRSLGAVEERPPMHGFFGYWQTMGMGYHEYLLMAEEIGATALPVLLPGMTARCPTPDFVPMSEIGAVVEDSLAQLEYIMGDSTTKWGAVRAAAGHPEPFSCRYVGIGNEAWGDEYWERYFPIAKAVRAKYPGVKIIASLWPRLLEHADRNAEQMVNVTPANCDIIDEHIYPSPSWWLNNTHRYDAYDRKGVKVYIGEYATRHAADPYINSMYAAVAEAAMRLGFERNSDIVELAAFAPLLRREGSRNAPMRRDGRPENRYSLIQTDGTDACGTPSYWVEKMFTDNLPERMVPVKCPEVKWTQPAGVDKERWFCNPSSAAMEVVSLHAAAGIEGQTLIVKLVNARWAPQPTVLSFAAPVPSGCVRKITLAGAPDAKNRPCTPSNVVPREDSFAFGGGRSLPLELPSCSVTVLRIGMK